MKASSKTRNISTAKKLPRRGVTSTSVQHYSLGNQVPTPMVREVCQRFHLVRQDLTRLTGYSLRAIDEWAAGKPPAAPAKKQLTELVRLFDALADLMSPEAVGPWLKSPNTAFANSTPLQVIERGEQDRLWRMVHQLETGTPD
jgi:hypothetical protein